MSLDAKEKGAFGEDVVLSEINSVISSLEFNCKVIQNARFPFESVYGERGYITAETDIAVFTPYLIFLFEVKNEKYMEFDYKEPLWCLMNGELVSNPIEQNHTHKEVFCSELRIPRENVITVEVLLENGCVPNMNSPYPNDYVFSLDDIKNKLVYLLATTSDSMIDVNYTFQQFVDLLQKTSISEEEHINCLKRTEKIETRIRNVIGYINLHRTDVVSCTSCGVGKLYFKDKNYLSTYDSKRESKHYFLGCSSYGKDNINCRAGLIYVDAYKDSSLFKEIKPDSIENRNNWGKEKVIKTILDEIETLTSANRELDEQLKMLTNENRKLREDLEESKRKNNSQVTQIMQLTKEKKSWIFRKKNWNILKGYSGKYISSRSDN